MAKKFFISLLAFVILFAYLPYTKTNQTDKKFLLLKNRGIKAIGENRLTNGINYLVEAQFIKTDEEIKAILDEAYSERAEYLYSNKELSKAQKDLELIKTRNESSELLLNKIKIRLSKPILNSPTNGGKIQSPKESLSWRLFVDADYYEIQIEDKNWNMIVKQIVNTNSFEIDNNLADQSVYYWCIRPHFSDYIWGVWSDKQWFSYETKEGKEKIKRDRLRNIIRILNIYPSSPSTTGGVGFHINWQNKSSKTIKYITFTVEPYNASGNLVKCETRKYSTFNARVTGPIYIDEWYGDPHHWENTWFNKTIVKIKLLKIDIIYMDGSTDNIQGSDIDIVRY